jgi:hypothetical protein
MSLEGVNPLLGLCSGPVEGFISPSFGGASAIRLAPRSAAPVLIPSFANQRHWVVARGAAVVPWERGRSDTGGELAPPEMLVPALRQAIEG